MSGSERTDGEWSCDSSARGRADRRKEPTAWISCSVCKTWQACIILTGFYFYFFFFFNTLLNHERKASSQRLWYCSQNSRLVCGHCSLIQFLEHIPNNEHLGNIPLWGVLYWDLHFLFKHGNSASWHNVLLNIPRLCFLIIVMENYL